ncbi:HlyD family secretion protein [Flagellimonas sediminis]|uniref:HlyD family efflux transporter periplasmic adaptor subunit n=1 Tax=Flagellimonas sediminis TaxID=2696468 RepID=A0A6I5KZF3_9FLAO|nr:HlyD family efflux transporter periplasmic adaptor subunit [Allomuricauda sediminis]NDV42841.1 HlyD family efflux transporter periplasmic adaptor subunit [Allomuricauda sediminis]
MQIFPKEIIENTIQSHLPKNGVKSKVIYGIILLALVLAIILLPFINIKVYTTARGIIKPSKERILITSLNSGKVLFTRMENNLYVQKGDILLVLENNVLDEQIALTEYDTRRYQEEIKDLGYLINFKNIIVDSIHSAKYQKEYIEYLQSSNEYVTRINKIKIDYDRNYKLLLKGVIAKVDFENIKFDYELALNAYNQFKKQQTSTWQATLTELESNLTITQNKNDQFTESKKEYVVTAPINGYLMNLSGVERGSIITSGVSLAEISPDAEIIAECFIKPMDIGLIDKSKPINFQIDAFNYNQWGLATGRILDVSQDVLIIENQPVFKLRCKINEHFLQLKNGAKGAIGKGMTFNARFELAERSLYQLLYDKLDDWMNPAQNTQISSTN